MTNNFCHIQHILLIGRKITKDTLILSTDSKLLAAFVFNPEELGDTSLFAATLLNIKSIHPPLKKQKRNVGGNL